jgi:zinc transporter ZupT
MARVIVALALLVYAGAGIAAAYLPQSRMPFLMVVAGAALVVAALVSILAQLGRGDPR